MCWQPIGPAGVPLLEVPMARTSIRERPDREEVLWPVQTTCPACGQPMRLRYDKESGKNNLNILRNFVTLWV